MPMYSICMLWASLGLTLFCFYVVFFAESKPVFDSKKGGESNMTRVKIGLKSEYVRKANGRLALKVSGNVNPGHPEHPGKGWEGRTVWVLRWVEPKIDYWNC